MKDISGASGFTVEGVSFGHLCSYIAELSGVVYSDRRRFFWSVHDIRAEFTFGGHSFKIRPDRDRRIWIRPKDETSSPPEIRDIRNYVAGPTARERRRAHRRALADATLSAFAAMTILIGGCLYPAYLLKYDPDIRNNPDSMAGPIIPIALVPGLILAALAAKRFYRARLDSSGAALQNSK